VPALRKSVLAADHIEPCTHLYSRSGGCASFSRAETTCGQDEQLAERIKHSLENEQRRGLTGVRLRHRPSIHAVLQVSRYCFPRVRSKRGLAEDLIFELRLLDGLHAPLRHETDRLGGRR